MRKITMLTARAFEQGERLAMSNTHTDGKGYYLHGHMIAERCEDGLYIDSCGWNTNTTRERLNGLSGVRVSTKQGQMYLNGKKWNGERVNVAKHGACDDSGCKLHAHD